MAHEFGHNFGVYHTRGSCKGIMSASSTDDLNWSSCSRRGLREYYSKTVQRFGSFCKSKSTPPNNSCKDKRSTDCQRVVRNGRCLRYTKECAKSCNYNKIDDNRCKYYSSRFGACNKRSRYYGYMSIRCAKTCNVYCSNN